MGEGGIRWKNLRPGLDNPACRAYNPNIQQGRCEDELAASFSYFGPEPVRAESGASGC